MKHYRWLIIFLAFIAIIINYMDRSALSYAISPLKETYGLTNTDFGIIASAFGVGYLLMTVGGGILVDRFGARKIWSLFGFSWSLACALIGLATGFGTLIVFRILLGVAEGPAFPALTRVAADWLPLKERARALGFGLAAVPFASVIGAPVITSLIESVGWRVMFFVLGLSGIIWSVVWYKLFSDQPQDNSHVSNLELAHIMQEHGASIPSNTQTSWRFILFNRTLMINNYAFFAFGYLLFFAITWLPGYLEQTYHLEMKTIGWFLILPWAVATVLILIGGALSDWLWTRTKSIRLARSHLIWVCQLLSVLCFIPVLTTPSLPVTAIGISLGIGLGLMPNAAFYAINADLAYDRAATSLGIMDGAFALASILAPLLTGWLASLTGSFAAPILLLMILTLSSSALIFFCQKPDDMINIKPALH